MRWMWGAAWIAAACLAGACGTDGGGGSKPSTGGGGTPSGGSDAGGVGGASGSGATGATGGSAGSGGTGGCASPLDASKAALCLTVAPETVKFQSSDPALDGEGILFVEIFETALPNASTIALASAAAPAQGSDGGLSQGKLADLAAQPFRFDGLPSTVYARVVFADNLSSFQSPGGPLVFGTWIGGVDVSKGLAGERPLLPIALDAGAAKSETVPLSALRKLSVTVSRAAALTPNGNGQGPLGMLAVPSNDIVATPNIFGIGALPCADVSGTSSAVVTGLVHGKGPYFVTAVLDDFGSGGALPAGSLASLEQSLKIPTQNQLVYAPDDYVVQKSIELTYLTAGTTGSDSVSCSTGGTDAGGD